MPRIGFAATAATWTAVVAIATMVAAWSLVSREGGTQAPLLVGVRGARSAFTASEPILKRFRLQKLTKSQTKNNQKSMSVFDFDF